MEVPIVDPYRIISKSTMLNTSRLEIEGAESADVSDVFKFSAQPCLGPPEHFDDRQSAGIFHECRNIMKYRNTVLSCITYASHESAINASALCNKLSGSYLGHQVPPKQFVVRERKDREGARAKKTQKGVQSIPNCQRSSEKIGLGDALSG